MILDIIIAILAAAGIGISIYIYTHKRDRKVPKKKLVCPIGGSCDPVIHSKWGKTFGIENTILGMLYYGAVLVVYGAGLLDFAFPEIIHFLVLAASIGAFLFSVYLIYIQAFKLRNWCSWCVASTLLTTGILVVSSWQVLA